MMDLPIHILVTILEAMDTRAVVRASMTCRALYDAAAQVRSLRPVLRPHTAADQLAWMGRRRDRVTHVRAVRLSPLSPCWAALPDFPALHTCMVALSRVPVSLVRSLPESLRTLDIHRLEPAVNDVFSTRALARFPNLRRAHITFAPGWALAVVGPGDLPPCLETLELRRIPAIAVTAPLPATRHVGLHALDVMSGRVHVAPRCASLALRCDATCIDGLSALIHPDVQALSICAPVIDDLGDVQAYPCLTALHLAARYFTVPDTSQLAHLTRLQLDAANCLVFDRRSAVPPGLRLLAASSQHRPLDIAPYLEMSAVDRAAATSVVDAAVNQSVAACTPSIV
jgi:hypothetical protein